MTQTPDAAAKLLLALSKAKGSFTQSKATFAASVSVAVL